MIQTRGIERVYAYLGGRTGGPDLKTISPTCSVISGKDVVDWMYDVGLNVDCAELGNYRLAFVANYLCVVFGRLGLIVGTM